MTVVAFLAGVLPVAVGTSFTPGPNNLMLASAGARFGFVRTWRHQLGIVVGFAVMMFCVGVGLSALEAAVPALHTSMKVASVAYVLFLAWRIGSAGTAIDDGAIGAPMGFLAAAGFQWINPKAWVITLTATATYTSPLLDARLQIALLVLVFAITGAGSTSTWAAFGLLIRRYLTSARRRKAFNWSMAALLVASITPILLE